MRGHRYLAALSLLTVNARTELVAALESRQQPQQQRFGGLPVEVVRAALAEIEEHGADLDLSAFGPDEPTVEPTLPVCAWRQSFNNKTLTWDVEYPDEYAIYMGMFIRLNKGDALRINGTYPSSRYMSFNTYSVSGDNFGESLTSVNDFHLVPSRINPFATADVPRGTTEYSLGITATGSEGGFDNEMRAFDNATSGLTLMLMRLYDVALLPGADDDKSYLWGYVDPPLVEFRRNGATSFTRLKQCKQRQQSILPYISNDATNTHVIDDCNYQNGFKIPNMGDLKCTLNDFDNQYIQMTGAFNKSTMSTLVGRAQFKLPSVAMVDRIPDNGDYDVRYASFTTYNLAPPRSVEKTLTDSMMISHYEGFFGDAWDRTVVVWMVLDEADIPTGWRNESDMVLPWTHSHEDGGMVQSVSGMYRQILTQTQRIGNEATFTKGIADVCPTCAIEDNECCNWSRGLEMPDWCIGDARVRSIMQEYYPTGDWWIDGVRQGPKSRAGFTAFQAAPPPQQV